MQTVKLMQMGRGDPGERPVIAPWSAGNAGPRNAREDRGGAAAARGGVLVTGSHRSGTTWVGRMLAEARGLCYLHEPFKPGWHPPYAWRKFDTWFQHIDAHNAGEFEGDLKRTMELRFSWRRHFEYAPGFRQGWGAAVRWARWTSRRLRGQRPLVKDPLALFAAPWLADRFGLGVVVMIRHPAAFASSIKLKRWHFDFNHLLRQRELMEDLLAPFERELHTLAERNDDLVEQAILQWRLFHHVIRAYQASHPHWLYVRHEDVSADPVGEFRQMYARLGLTFTPACERAVRDSSDGANILDAAAAGLSTQFVQLNSAANIKNWQRRLTPHEITRIRDGTADIAHHFYSKEDWAPAAAH